MNIWIELLKLAVIAGIVFSAFWLISAICRVVWGVLDDTAEGFNDASAKAEPKYSHADENMECDGCGSRPWHIEWDPDCRKRKSRKFYCPNCTGAT